MMELKRCFLAIKFELKLNILGIKVSIIELKPCNRMGKDQKSPLMKPLSQ